MSLCRCGVAVIDARNKKADWVWLSSARADPQPMAYQMAWRRLLDNNALYERRWNMVITDCECLPD